MLCLVRQIFHFSLDTMSQVGILQIGIPKYSGRRGPIQSFEVTRQSLVEKLDDESQRRRLLTTVRLTRRHASSNTTSAYCLPNTLHHPLSF